MGQQLNTLVRLTPV